MPFHNKLPSESAIHIQADLHVAVQQKRTVRKIHFIALTFTLNLQLAPTIHQSNGAMLTCITTPLLFFHIYIYIYIQRESEREEREMEKIDR